MTNATCKGKNALKIMLAVTPLFCVSTFLNAQTASVQDARSDRDKNVATRQELATFDQFLDNHCEIAEQLRKDPSLADNNQFEKTHPAFQTFLQQHPQIQQDLRQDPKFFMHQEDTFDRREDQGDRDAVRRQRDDFDRFLGGHREIADQLRRNPGLANDQQFLRTHPELDDYLRQQPDVRADLRRDADGFMRQDDRDYRADNETNRNDVGRNDAGRNDGDRNEVARNDAGRNDSDYDRNDTADRRDDARPGVKEFNQFLADHPEIAEQLRKNPSLANREDFLEDAPGLASLHAEAAGRS